jgi:hypothetical protein
MAARETTVTALHRIEFKADAASAAANLAVVEAKKAAESAAQAHASAEKAHQQDLVVAENVKELQVRLDDLSLNGHGPDLKRFMTEDMPVVREMVQQVKDREAVEREERRKALARSRTWWYRALHSKVVWTLVGAAVSAATYAIVAHIFG